MDTYHPHLDDAYNHSSNKSGRLRLKRPVAQLRPKRDPTPEPRPRSASPPPYPGTPESSRKRKRTKKPTVAETDDPALYDDVHIPGQNSFKYKDPETAFRESLFEAMADDEGAAYYEGVYGQPIHNYARPYVENEKGKFEAMNDDEYAEYVRRQMWKKSYQYAEEQRAARERVRKEAEENKKKAEAAREAAEKQADWDRYREMLRYEAARRRKTMRKEDYTKKAWEAYATAWEDLTKKEKTEGRRLRILWPVHSGLRSDVTKEAVEKFFTSVANMLRTAGPSERKSYADLLRAERVRWHPDKALQRWGKNLVTDDLLKGMTAVFQIIDDLWAKERDGGKR
ncbi:hypothetical protein ABW21_db0202124 [Orbilia brochopaga]|nr:hypothetical protein ABW21_db0202124 [Drechslerella brochopaga]